jgi:hypothetical protein
VQEAHKVPDNHITAVPLKASAIAKAAPNTHEQSTPKFRYMYSRLSIDAHASPLSCKPTGFPQEYNSQSNFAPTIDLLSG